MDELLMHNDTYTGQRTLMHGAILRRLAEIFHASRVIER
jgi:hypothetical protein